MEYLTANGVYKYDLPEDVLDDISDMIECCELKLTDYALIRLAEYINS